MDARDRHNGQRDKRTDGRTEDEKTRRRLFVRPSVRLLDGVWHYIWVIRFLHSSHSFFHIYTPPTWRPSCYDNDVSWRHFTSCIVNWQFSICSDKVGAFWDTVYSVQFFRYLDIVQRR